MRGKLIVVFGIAALPGISSDDGRAVPPLPLCVLFEGHKSRDVTWMGRDIKATGSWRGGRRDVVRRERRANGFTCCDAEGEGLGDDHLGFEVVW